MAAARARVVTSRATGPDLADLSGPYLMALLGGDESAVEEFVSRARIRGADTAVVVRDLVAPALAEVGRMWARREVSIAEEHLATALASRALARSSGAAGPRTAARRVVFACLEGEFHDIGIRLLVHVARECGWDAESLGANVPREALVAFVAQRPPSAVAISVSLACHVPEAARAIAEIRIAAPGVTILVGGRAFCEDTERVGLSGADAGICDAVALRDWLLLHACEKQGKDDRAAVSLCPAGLPAELPSSLRRRCRAR